MDLNDEDIAATEEWIELLRNDGDHDIADRLARMLAAYRDEVREEKPVREEEK